MNLLDLYSTINHIILRIYFEFGKGRLNLILNLEGRMMRIQI